MEAEIIFFFSALKFGLFSASALPTLVIHGKPMIREKI
jgi:hypothetical protein